MIRHGLLQDLDEIKQLTEACANALQKLRIQQWNENYPSRQRLEEDILRKELYVLQEEEKIVGIIVLTPEMDQEYIPINWLTCNGNSLYVHRVATLPSNWGQGGGRLLMDFAEKTAREANYLSIRLDTFSQNKRNQRFYLARGYKRLGDIYFPKQSPYPFHCYEKLLS